MPSPTASTQPFDATITVVIPLYNGARLLDQTIQCVLNQTLPPDEILAIDDGSRDNSAEVARKYPQVTVIQQPNAGVCATRNRGAAMARGAWIAFIDQDDLWEPNKLERQVETLRANPSADACVTGRYFLHQRGESGESELSQPYPAPPSHKVAKSIYGFCPFTPSAVLIRKSSLLAVNGFDHAATPCEDWDLWLRLEQAGAKFVSCTEPLMTFRMHNTNTSFDAERQFRKEMEVYERRIAPRIPAIVRPLHRLHVRGRNLGQLARINREQGKPHLAAMWISLLTAPIGEWARYKMCAHMTLKAAHLIK